MLPIGLPRGSVWVHVSFNGLPLIKIVLPFELRRSPGRPITLSITSVTETPQLPARLFGALMIKTSPNLIWVPLLTAVAETCSPGLRVGSIDCVEMVKVAAEAPGELTRPHHGESKGDPKRRSTKGSKSPQKSSVTSPSRPRPWMYFEYCKYANTFLQEKR